MNKSDFSESIKKKNILFFSKNRNYQKNINEIDTYKILYDEITDKLKKTKKLLDVGHGGCFDYNTSIIEEIVGLDLDEMVNPKSLPKNVKLIVGSALNIPTELRNFDTVIFVMLIHHLIGKNVN